MKSWFPKPLTSTPTCCSGHSKKKKKKQFSTQNLLQMKNVDTNWNLEWNISKIQILQL